GDRVVDSEPVAIAVGVPGSRADAVVVDVPVTVVVCAVTTDLEGIGMNRGIAVVAVGPIELPRDETVTIAIAGAVDQAVRGAAEHEQDDAGRTRHSAAP